VTITYRRLHAFSVRVPDAGKRLSRTPWVAIVLTLFSLTAPAAGVESRSDMERRIAAAGFLPLVARDPYIWEGEVVNLYGLPRQFDFSGDRPFVNPVTGQSDLATLQADSQVVPSGKISEVGLVPAIVRLVDERYPQHGPAIRVTVEPSHRVTSGSWRSQLASYQVLPYRIYRWVLVFRLDDSWDLDLFKHTGLIWQLKGAPREGQHGNPVIAFNIRQRELYCAILYPSTARTVPPGGRVQWRAGEYEQFEWPRKTIDRGSYYTIELEVRADDRPAQFGGRGYARAWFDGEPWFSYDGATLHPDQAAPHQTAFGWYQWESRPTQSRIVWWLRNAAFVRDLP